MKTFIIVAAFLMFTYNMSAQIVIGEFEYTSGYAPVSIESFKTILAENLRQSFYILEGNLSSSYEEIARSQLKEFFKKSIDPNFIPTAYKLTANISESVRGVRGLFHINIELVNIETRKKYFIAAQFIPETDLNKAASYIYQFIKNTIPTYYPIIAYQNDEEITIKYGRDRAAKDGDMFDLVSIAEGVPVGEIEVNQVRGETSFCDFDLFYNNVDFSRNTFSEFYAETIIDPDEANEFKEYLSDLSVDPEDWMDQGSTKDHNLFTISLQNFYFKNYNISKYFNNTRLTPYEFGAQFNFLPIDNFCFFVKGRVSLVSEQLKDEFDAYTTSKLMYYQGGGGVKFEMPVSNLFFTGVSASVQYMEILISKENYSKLISSQYFKGFDAELSAYCTIRLYQYFGVYGEVSYHFFPSLNGPDEKLNTSAVSIGLGLAYFVD